MTNRYFVRYNIKTPNTVAGIEGLRKKEISGYDFISGKDKSIIYDVPIGLTVDSYIYFDNITNTEKKSLDTVYNIINLIDFSTSTSSNPPLIDMVYEASPEKEVRAIKKFFNFTLIGKNFVLIDKEILNEAFDKFIKVDDERIILASDWLKKGNSEQTVINKFISYWVGLETLNVLLCDYFKIKPEDRKWVCDKCGKMISPLKSIGTKVLFEDILEIDNKRFNKIRRARGKLLHGDCSVDNAFIEEIKAYNPIIKEGLIRGLGILLDLDSNTIKTISGRISRMYQDSFKLVASTKIKDFYPPDLEKMFDQPQIELLINNQKMESIKVNEVNKIIKEGEIRIDFIGLKTKGKIEIQVTGNENSCVENFKIIQK